MWLEQYKTYIVGAVMIVIAVSKFKGWIDDKLASEIMTILVGLGFGTLAAGKNRIENDVKTIRSEIKQMNTDCTENKG